MKKRLLTMLVLMLVAVGTLFALNATSNAPNRIPNGFERKFLPIESTIVQQLEFATPVRELAGTHGDSLFLMTIEPGKVYVTDTKLKKPSIILLEDPKIQNIVPRFYTTVCYPEVYILGGNATEYAVGNLITGKTRKEKLKLNGLFNNPMVMDSNLIMQVTDNTTLTARFVTVDMDGNIIAKENDLSQGSGDAGFVYSGLLRYDATGHKLVYVHFFDNGFDVFSPNLELAYRGHTIDTTNTNPTKVTISGKAVSYTHPPVRINSYAAVYDGYLYISSKLLADNEDKRSFYNHTAVDKYKLDDGSYAGSFYLPHVDGEAISQFYFLSESQLLAFSEKNVVIININKKRFGKPNA